MIDATVVPSLRDLLLMASMGVHDPSRGRVARGGAAEDNPLAIGRLAHPKVGRIGRREARDRIIPRIEPAEFRAAARQVRFVIAVEMVGIRSLWLEFPGHFGAGQSPRKEDGIIMRPGD